MAIRMGFFSLHFTDLSTIIYGCIIIYHPPTGKGLAEEMRYFFVHYLDNAATTPVPGGICDDLSALVPAEAGGYGEKL